MAEIPLKRRKSSIQPTKLSVIVEQIQFYIHMCHWPCPSTLKFKSDKPFQQERGLKVLIWTISGDSPAKLTTSIECNVKYVNTVESYRSFPLYLNTTDEPQLRLPVAATSIITQHIESKS